MKFVELKDVESMFVKFEDAIYYVESIEDFNRLPAIMLKRFDWDYYLVVDKNLVKIMKRENNDMYTVLSEYNMIGENKNE